MGGLFLVVDSVDFSGSGLQLVLGKDELGFGAVGDGVVLLTAIEGDELEAGEARQALGQDAVSVSDVLVNFRAGVAAGEAAEGEGAGFAFRVFRRQGEFQVAAGSAGASYGENAFGFGVQVNKQTALEAGTVQGGGSEETDFFVYSKYGLNRRVREGIAEIGRASCRERVSS